MKKILKTIFEKQFNLVGFCAFEDVLPLLKCNKAIDFEAKGVICCIFPYERLKGEMSSYAQAEDYHKKAECLMKNALDEVRSKFTQNKFVGFCDSSPINEVKTAALCALGVIGKNNLIITKEYGSFVHICTVVTDLDFETEGNIQSCIDCGICIESCPTKALKNNGFDKERCISHISQKKGDFSEFEKECFLKGNSIWGCDICINVCPMNKKIAVAGDNRIILNLNELENMTNKEFKEKYGKYAFAWRGKQPLIRNIKTKSN
ncbi:MAG: epoxyqueuosine reductase [Ruminococcaceae bacterium]|nr:epoxyqueuosine reductase [Oscillospiraceae bacterium]